MHKYNAIVVGCGLSGAVVARFLAEEMGRKVLVLERRNHVGGNMYDYQDEAGILVHQYGPHTFHTRKKHLYEYMCKYGEWEEYRLTCGAVINEKYTPTPFNFQTIDDFYEVEKAEKIKSEIKKEFPGQKTATVLEMLNHSNSYVREYAEFLFENDYSLYTAKQWGISPKEIDPSVLKRVPIRFGYEEGYFDDKYQVMPKKSYTEFFGNLLKHPNVEVQTNSEMKDYVKLDVETGEILVERDKWKNPFVFTGAIDELFEWKYGMLPYRSLRFEWKTENKESFQPAPVVAYPQAKDFVRITEYTKLPVQKVGEKTTYAVEYSVPYRPGIKTEPYYPIPNKENFALYQKYRELAEEFPNLYLSGRLAEYKYFNMDQALENALELCEKIRTIY